MTFLETADFTVQIHSEILERLGGPAELDRAELIAKQEIESYLSAYDCAALWALTGSDRPPLIVMYLIDLALYHLHSKVAPRQIPEIRAERYDAAIAYLKAVAVGKLTAPLQRPAEAENTGRAALVTAEKRNNRF